MEEIWRKVEGFDNYEISNQNGWRNIKGKEFPIRIKSNGYRYVSLGRKAKQRTYHTLVAKTFPEICGKWFKGCVVHHKNFNKLDNRPENLIILSQSEHSTIHYNETVPDKYKKPSPERNKAISQALKGKKYPSRQRPILQLSKNGAPINRFDSIKSIKEQLGYSCGNICMCCKGQMKTAYGFLWQYAVK